MVQFGYFKLVELLFDYLGYQKLNPKTILKRQEESVLLSFQKSAFTKSRKAKVIEKLNLFQLQYLIQFCVCQQYDCPIP